MEKTNGPDRSAAIRDLLRERQPNLSLLPPDRIDDVTPFLCVMRRPASRALPVDGGWTAQ